MLTAINLLVFFLQVLTEECKGAALFTTNTKEQFTTNTTTRFTTNTTQINKNTTPVNKNINIQINNKVKEQFTTNTTEQFTINTTTQFTTDTTQSNTNPRQGNKNTTRLNKNPNIKFNKKRRAVALFTTNTTTQFTTNTTQFNKKITPQLSKNTTQFNKITRRRFNTSTTEQFTTNTTTRSGRHRRWDEEAYDDYSEGEIDYKDESEEESRIKKLLLNWEKLALKFIFAISFIVMIVCCIVNWLMKWVKNIYRSCAVCFKLCAASCCSCCLEGDANYQRAKMFAERFGLKLSYENYKQLMDTAKKGAEQAAQSQMQSM
ncbi:uncharacterized protein LOC128173623 [Crassostrea angulata]|uniref:uncharacterized protein LOC128173623 n=1 Tax=Magallana angulata TaxID=2784310 RepID=UPI0022B1B443|nr:uncharacterized protein LOC128173623 [Crassostrea angulata]